MKKIIYFFAFLLFAGNSLSVIAQALKPSATHALISVEVLDDKKTLLPGEEVLFESLSNKKVYSGITKDSGRFEILIPKGDKYLVKYKSLLAVADYTTIDVPNNEGEMLKFNVTVQFDSPKKYTLDNVYFESGKAVLNPVSFKELDAMVEYMKLKKTLVLEISGHTDNVGIAAANLKLSQDRANAVRDYLVKKGIETNRIVPKGYGDTQPIADNSTDQGKKKNRRTEAKIVKD